MPVNKRRLILASASPRRRELLSKLGFTFEIIAPDADEHARGDVISVVKTLSLKKALAVKPLAGDGDIVASDTLVSIDGEILGKPADAEDAKRMLGELSGREHDVYTGVCLMNAATGEYMLEADHSAVTFNALSDTQIADYVATGEPMDRAGAYAIQAGAGAFVKSIRGSFENVMGFPTQLFEDMYARFTKEN